MPAINGVPLQLDQESLNAPVSMQEQTRGQVAVFNGPFGVGSPMDSVSDAGKSGIVGLGQNWLTGNMAHYIKVRRMRKHPTIKLTRVLSIAAMATAEWSVSTTPDAPEGSKELVSDLLGMQSHFLASALPGLFDFGWAPYEKVFYWNTKEQQTRIKKLKPLLQDYTRIMVTYQNGAFAGYKQFNKFLSLSNSLLLNQDAEAGYLYGESTMSAIEPAYDRWLVTDQSNVQYDRKISGAHWVVWYPVGFSKNPNGSDSKLNNFDIAKTLLATLEGSGSIAVPSQVLQFAKDLNTDEGREAWRIEIMAAPSAQADFSTRLQYLDTLMVRGGEFPERAILEGQYGTKAEAGEHADFAIARMDFRNKCVVDALNWHVSNQLLRLNYGQEAENKAYLQVSPIADDKKDFLKQVFMAVLSNPSASTQQISAIDLHAIRDQLKLPSTDRDDEGDENLNNMLSMLQQQHDQEQALQGTPYSPLNDEEPQQYPPNSTMAGQPNS